MSEIGSDVPFTCKDLIEQLRCYSDGILGKNELVVGPNMASFAMSTAADFLEVLSERSRELADIEKDDFTTLPQPYRSARRLEGMLRRLMGGDEKMQVGIGGNPTYVEEFISEARALLKEIEEAK